MSKTSGKAVKVTKFIRFSIAVITPLFYIVTANSQSLPEFSLKCNVMGIQSNHRLASNGAEIYFASIDGKQNIEDVKESIENLVESRTILMSFWDSSAEPRWPRMALDRDGTHEVQGRLARDTLIFQLGKRQFTCEKILDTQMFLTLKLAYENRVLEAMQKQKIYNNRPNQL